MKDNVNQIEQMTHAPIPKLITVLSIPSIISMLITNIYNLVDTGFVGRLGTSASGAVGIVFGFMSIIQAFGFMFGQGAGSILSRLLGKEDIKRASVFSTCGFFCSFVSGFIVLVFGFIFLDRLIFLLGSTTTIFPYAKDYIFYILIAAPFMASSLTLNNIIRYEGHAYLGMLGLVAGAVLNMIGDPIFMFYMNMGIAGAGLSTALSQIVSFLILIFMFLSGRTITKINFKSLKRFNFDILTNIVTTGFPSLLRQGLSSFSTVILNAECAFYGDAAVSAMSIVSRIFFFALSVVLGIGQGFQPVAGMNYGAEKYDRLKRAFYFTIFISEIFVVVEALWIYFKAPELIQIFRDDPEVIRIGTRALKLQILSQLFVPPCVDTEMLFQSIGKRFYATFLSSLRNGILFIPLLIGLAYFRGLSGIEEAQPWANILSFPLTIPLAIYFIRTIPKETNR